MNFDNLHVLKGSVLKNATRAGRTVSLTFEKNELDYFFHIECLVRFIKNSTVYTTSEDILYPDYTPDTWENFNWVGFEEVCSETIGINLYDLRVSELFNGQCFSVIDVVIDSIGSITVLFNNNLILQIIINSINSERKWYFFCGEKADCSPLVCDNSVHYFNAKRSESL